MIVLKFGGAALAEAARGENTVRIIEAVKDQRPIVVVSAMKGITDLLLAMLDQALARREGLPESLRQFRQKHEAVLAELVTSPAVTEDLSRAMDFRVDELGTLLESVANLRECTAKCKDLVVSFGERFSARGLAGILNSRGLESQAIDARELVRTDSVFGNASVDWSTTGTLVRAQLLPLLEAGVIPVVTGFIGANDQGQTTTLGRGGTDLTAALVAHCLDADEVRYYKEVDGFLTVDPTLVPGGKHIAHMSYDEVAELSFFGAKILHPIAIRPLREKGIPATLRSFFHPDQPGTRVDGEPPPARHRSWALTSLKNVALIDVEGPGFLDNPGMAGRVFSATAAAGASVLMISQSSSERNISFVVPAAEAQQTVAQLEETLELERLKGQIERIDTQGDLAILCAVGRSLRADPAMTAAVLSALAAANVTVQLLAQGGSLLNVSCVIPMARLQVGLEAVHRQLTSFVDQKG